MKLSPRPHRLQIDPRTLKIFVRGDEALEAPEGWALFRPHPPIAKEDRECRSCHTVDKEGQGVTVSAPRTPMACDPCHSDLEFEGTHYHPKEPVAACQRCHALHGSSRPALLKKPVKELCAACHE